MFQAYGVKEDFDEQRGKPVPRKVWESRRVMDPYNVLCASKPGETLHWVLWVDDEPCRIETPTSDDGRIRLKAHASPSSELSEVRLVPSEVGINLRHPIWKEGILQSDWANRVAL